MKKAQSRRVFATEEEEEEEEEQVKTRDDDDEVLKKEEEEERGECWGHRLNMFRREAVKASRWLDVSLTALYWCVVLAYGAFATMAYFNREAHQSWRLESQAHDEVPRIALTLQTACSPTMWSCAETASSITLRERYATRAALKKCGPGSGSRERPTEDFTTVLCYSEAYDDGLDITVPFDKANTYGGASAFFTVTLTSPDSDLFLSVDVEPFQRKTIFLSQWLKEKKKAARRTRDALSAAFGIGDPTQYEILKDSALPYTSDLFYDGQFCEHSSLALPSCQSSITKVNLLQPQAKTPTRPRSSGYAPRSSPTSRQSRGPDPSWTASHRSAAYRPSPGSPSPTSGTFSSPTPSIPSPSSSNSYNNDNSSFLLCTLRLLSLLVRDDAGDDAQGTNMSEEEYPVHNILITQERAFESKGFGGNHLVKMNYTPAKAEFSRCLVRRSSALSLSFFLPHRFDVVAMYARRLESCVSRLGIVRPSHLQPMRGHGPPSGWRLLFVAPKKSPP